MKKLVLVFLLFFSGGYLFPQQAPDSIKSFPGIPILTYLEDEMNWVHEEDFYKKIDSAGIYATEVADMSSTYQPYLNITKFKVLPVQIDPSLNRGILKYSGARYSIWEAEGTNPAVGDATVYHKSTVGEIYNGSVRTLTGQGIVNDTLIYGPYYLQDAASESDWITYNADFKLKKENISSPPPLPNSIVCILQVTTSHAVDSPPNYPFDSTWVVKADTITYSMLADTFKSFRINYYYQDVPRLFTPGPTDTSFYFRTFANFVQYKVIWKGNSNYIRLYVDNIIVTDLIGKDFIEFPSVVENGIVRQMNDNWDNKVAGWVGVDEPLCIDQYKSMSIVQDIINSNPNGKSVWYAYGNNWNGRWGDYRNPHGSYPLFQFEELYKKLNKINLWSDIYIYTYPDYSYGSDWRDGKIKATVDSIYSRFQGKNDVCWGASVMGGLYGNPISWLSTREINSKDLLYSVNIALLAGAKVISIWKYFANIDAGVTPLRTGLVNIYWPTSPPYDNVSPSYYEYTDKWYTLKDTVAPRLKGLMGQRLKILTAMDHFLNINALTDPNNNVPHDFIDYIQATGGPNDTSIIDLGIFQDPQNTGIKYFMPVNRYYSTKGNLTFGLKNLTGYSNWKLTDFVDTVYSTIHSIAGNAQFTDTIYAGDAKLYSLQPVIKSGGNLLYNDTVSATGATLNENELFVKSGATLVVKGVYNIYKNITVEVGGNLFIAPGGALNFYDNANLIVDGSLTNSQITSKAVLNFQNGSGSLVLRDSITVSNLSINNTTAEGIRLDASINSSVFSVVKNSTFTNCGVGISGAGINKFMVQGNSFESCTEAVRFTSSSSLYIISNSFNDCGFALSLYSSSYVKARHNFMNGCGYGIYMGNSAVDAGDNNIQLSDYNGIYAGFNSLLNIQGIMKVFPCNNTILYSFERGYNRIYDNFNVESGQGSGDGAEIFLREAVLLADSGSNEIYDNREPSTIPTQNLIAGSYQTFPDTIGLSNNEWGSENYYRLDERFGLLPVNYEPRGILPPPQSSSGCIVINTINSTDGPAVVDTLDDTNKKGSDGPDYWDYMDQLYTQEAEYRALGDYASSEITLKTLISVYLNEDKCLEAFDRLYSNYTERGATAEEFGLLRDYYLSLLNECTNQQNIESITHYADLCLEQQGLYSAAMGSFQNTIDTYPGTERADFATIDLYTAALLDTSQHLGKSLVKVTPESYNKKIQEILLKKIGKWDSKTTRMLPTEYLLYQNYPNPFNPSTTIRYAVKDRSEIKLTVFDILGRAVKELVNEVKEPGYYEVNFNMSNYASGVYFYTLQTKQFVKTNKMLLIK